MKIIPGILARSKKEYVEQLKTVSWSKKVHIDISDGSFVRGRTFVGSIHRNAQIHLMVQNPVAYLKKFPKSEVIVHAEADNVLEALRLARKHKQKIGLALNPKTSIQIPLLKLADFVLVMTVVPGKSGRKMLKAPLRKIGLIKKLRNIPVGVDGGVNQKTIRAVVKAGADFAVAASAVTLSDNPKKSFRELKKLT